MADNKNSLFMALKPLRAFACLLGSFACLFVCLFVVYVFVYRRRRKTKFVEIGISGRFKITQTLNSTPFFSGCVFLFLSNRLSPVSFLVAAFGMI